MLNCIFHGAFSDIQQSLTLGFEGETLLDQGGNFRLDCSAKINKLNPKLINCLFKTKYLDFIAS